MCVCVCVCLCVCERESVCCKQYPLRITFLPLVSVILSITADDVKQRDVVEDLVTIVPGVQSSLSGVVVHHADVGVLVVEGNVSVFIC